MLVVNATVSCSRCRINPTAHRQPSIVNASIVNMDQGMLQIPVSAITGDASRLTLDLKAIGGSYTATVGRDSAGLIGTIKMGDITAPLTFQRAATSHE